MDYRLLIARRYLVSRRRITLISVVSGISVGGVALGVAALVVVLSVMNGFFDTVRDLLVSYDPHVRIESTGTQGIVASDSVLRIVRGTPHVVSAAPFAEGQALLTPADGSTTGRVVTVRGVDLGLLDSTVARAVTSGRFDVARRPGQAPGLVMGRSAANRMTLAPAVDGRGGSQVALLSAPALEGLVTMYPFGLPPEHLFAVQGLFELDPTYDESHVFVSLEEAQRLFRLTGRVSGLDLRLTDVDQAGTVKHELESALGPGYRVRTWYDLQPSLYSTMLLEKWAASAILVLIIVVAAFNIVGALTMIVVEKRRDLGALQAMGASRRDVAAIFLLEGLLVGGLGAGLGLALGLGLAVLQQVTGFVKLAQAESFIIDAYPIAIRLFDVGLVAAVAICLCALAAVYPAHRAAAVAPAEAVRSAG